MNEARKNGTKPKIAPFRLSTKPSIKDAPIFEDIAYTKKKRPLRKLSTSTSEGNEETTVKEQVTETVEQDQKTDITPFGKMTASSTKKLFGDPLKYKVADPFAIMTAEPDEDEPAEDLTVEPEKESATEEFAPSVENETTESAEKETAETADKEATKGESAELAIMVSAESAKNESV
ncbi:Hypothetical predicted protein, partial [Paramuricea clavata]